MEGMKNMLKSFEIVGHRGLPLNHPENTIGSFRDAFENGSDSIELDVHLTKDRVPVVFHDFNLSRLLGIDTDIGSIDHSELSHMVINNSSDRIPDLDEVLKSFPDHNIYIELKTITDDGKRCYHDLPEIVNEELRKYPSHKGRRTVISFDPLSLSDFRSLNTETPVALDISESYSEWMTVDDLKDLIDEIGLNSLLPELSVLGDFTEMRDHLGNPNIVPWTVNIFTDIIPFMDKIDGVITDRCDIIRDDLLSFNNKKDR